MKFNINKIVRVKLTKNGRKVHRDQHTEFMHVLKSHGGKGWEYEAPKEDGEGWSEWQLWCLMKEFGHYMNNGFDPPFETEIDIPRT